MYISPIILNQSIGQTVTVGGFVHNIRDHGGLIFIDLRSQSELLQCVISIDENSDLFAQVEHIRPEYVLSVTGVISERSQETVNVDLPTGKIELLIESMEVVSKAKTLPFDIHGESGLAGEDIRLKYRYLDLRRKKLKTMLTQKHKLFLATRNWFDKEDFIEVNTPILANSTPEGSRDYLVPSRIHPGKFYALPQAPQQFKQLLMVGGFNKYFQIAPCFRDEDPRADRHPGDFYQLDVEVAWAKQKDIFELCERYAKEILINFTDKKLSSEPVKYLTYNESMDKYGVDKPDLRYELAWVDAKPVFADSGFKVFADLCGHPETRVQALVIKNAVDKFSRSDLDKVQDIGRKYGLPGIAYIQYFQEEVKSPIFKFFGDEAVQEQKKAEIAEYFGAQTGDLVLFLANQEKAIVWKAQHYIREYIAKHLDLIDENLLQFAWVYDFPFFEKDDKTGKVEFCHNPFSSWQNIQDKNAVETLEYAKDNGKLLDLLANQYDFTLNGYEILSGGVRNPNPQALMAAFQLVGYTEDEVKNKFRHMLDAYEYGAPPHSGFAFGLEKILMILIGEENIRETIAFPKNGSGVDLMTDSPSEVDKHQLKELSIKLDI